MRQARSLFWNVSRCLAGHSVYMRDSNCYHLRAVTGHYTSSLAIGTEDLMSESREIPKHLIDKHKEGVEALTFYGVPVTELDRDGLLAFANCCAQQIQAAHKTVRRVL